MHCGSRRCEQKALESGLSKAPENPFEEPTKEAQPSDINAVVKNAWRVNTIETIKLLVYKVLIYAQRYFAVLGWKNRPGKLHEIYAEGMNS